MNPTAAIAVRAPDSYEKKIKKHVLAKKIENWMLRLPEHITNYFILGSTWKTPSHVQGIVTPPRLCKRRILSTSLHRNILKKKALNIEYLHGPKVLVITFQSWAKHSCLWKIVPLPRQWERGILTTRREWNRFWMYIYKFYNLRCFHKLRICLHMLATLISRSGNRTPATAIWAPDPNH